jgi:hypothetical protein
MKIRKETLKRLIKEEYERMQSEARRDPYFNDYGYQEKDYPDYKEMDRRERGGMGYDEPEEDEDSSYAPPPKMSSATKSTAPAAPAAEKSALQKAADDIVASYNRYDSLDLLPGNFWDKPGRKEAWSKIKSGTATEEDMKDFFK